MSSSLWETDCRTCWPPHSAPAGVLAPVLALRPLSLVASSSQPARLPSASNHNAFGSAPRSLPHSPFFFLSFSFYLAHHNPNPSLQSSSSSPSTPPHSGEVPDRSYLANLLIIESTMFQKVNKLYSAVKQIILSSYCNRDWVTSPY